VSGLTEYRPARKPRLTPERLAFVVFVAFAWAAFLVVAFGALR
jgi:hypothetical protein